MVVRIRTGGRLHFGFRNLSLVHDRLYGSLGVAIDEPQLRVSVEAAGSIDVDRADISEVTGTVVDLLSVPGAAVRIEQPLPTHMGLGSGTQVAMAILSGIAAVYDIEVDRREVAPTLGRGGRSGVGITAFERGGFVMDAGQPVDRYTSDRPPSGTWSVPGVIAHHELPADWRFVIIIPDANAGRHGDQEDASLRSIITRASPSISDELDSIILRRLLPAIVDRDIETFGRTVSTISRLNGAWYADVQQGIFRPPAGDIIRELNEDPTILGAGQSSWGPTVFGLTDIDRIESARIAAERALATVGSNGTVHTAIPRSRGAEIHVDE